MPYIYSVRKFSGWAEGLSGELHFCTCNCNNFFWPSLFNISPLFFCIFFFLPASISGKLPTRLIRLPLLPLDPSLRRLDHAHFHFNYTLKWTLLNNTTNCAVGPTPSTLDAKKFKTFSRHSTYIYYFFATWIAFLKSSKVPGWRPKYLPCC